MRNKILMTAIIVFALTGRMGAGLVFEYKASPRIVTPDGNSSNDRFYIFYRNADPTPSGSVFNLLGMRVGSFRNEGYTGSNHFQDPAEPPSSPLVWEARLYWDARSAPSGIYIWQIESGNEIYTGTVVVAR